MNSIAITSTSEASAKLPPTSKPTTAANYLLTKEYIMKECVRQGYYRTPSCNEKLYLHHKGFDGVDPTAFKEYTDVKVLWLEGNCFSSLSCGKLTVTPEQQSETAATVVSEVEVKSDEVAFDTSTASPKKERVELDKPVAVESSVEGNTAAPSKSGNNKTQTETTTADSVASSPAVKEEVDIFDTMYPTLRQLFLHGNLFNEMPNLQAFEKLDTINLSDNFIPRIESFCSYWRSAAEMDESAKDDEQLPSPQKSAAAVVPHTGAQPATLKRDANAMAALRAKVEKWASRCKHAPLDEKNKCLCSTLSTLTMKNNHLKTADDIAALLCYKNLSVLDLSTNKLEDGEAVLEILERMPNLKALQLSGNPCVRAISNYRKTVIARCKLLLHLDDRPVFDDERRLVNAWATGGLDAEKKERQLMKQEEEARQERRLREFREMMAAARGEAALDTSTEDDTDSNPTPSSQSEDETSNSNKNAIVSNKEKRPKTAPASSGRVLSSNQRSTTQHTEFYERNYGSKRDPEDEPQSPPAAVATQEADVVNPEAPSSSLPGDGPNSVSFGNFRVVSKSTPTGHQTAPATSALRGGRQVSKSAAQQHADPMQMEQVAVPSTLPPIVDDDDDEEVWVPQPKK